MAKNYYETFVDVDTIDQAFLEEFGHHLNDAQIDAITSGFRANINAEQLPDPNDIDPVADPVTALAVVRSSPQSKIELGEKPFVLPLIPYIKAAGEAIPPDVKLLSKQYDCFLIKYGLNAVLQDKERFVKVEFKVDYPKEQVTYSLAPNTELEEKVSARIGATIGIDPHLGFRVPDVDLGSINVGGGASAGIDTGFFYEWEYKPLQAKVITTGAKSSYAQWIINEPKRMIGDIEFSTVMLVPREQQEMTFTVTGQYDVSRGILWWNRVTPMLLRTKEPMTIPLPTSV